MIRSAVLDRSSLSMLAVAALCALVVGVLVVTTSPLVPTAVLLVLCMCALIWSRPALGMFLFVGVVALLPFGVIPVPIAGAQLTLVDAVLLATLSAVLGRVAFDRWRLPVGSPGVAMLAFVVVALSAFVASASNGIQPELMRRFGKLVVSLLFLLVVRALLHTRMDRVARLTRWLMYAGALQGAIGATLILLPPAFQLSVLTRLQLVGYPTTDVLRFVPGPNNSYTDQLRAIGTSVDPNVFGGTLMLALALIVVQWAVPRPVLPRAVLVLLAVPTAAGVVLSLSRASWLGLSAGLLLVGGLRYRRILVLGAFFALALIFTPVGHELIARFVGGLSTADRATAFRLGEYANALTLLQRYPLLGIGFGASPDIDVTAGVSSVYLLVAEQTGLIGLGVYLVALGTTWWIGIRDIRRMQDQRLQGIRAAFLAAFSGALVAGLLDHYFANQVFPHAVALFWLYAAALLAVATTPTPTPPLATSTTTPAGSAANPPPRQREPERTAHARTAARRPNRASVEHHQLPRDR